VVDAPSNHWNFLVRHIRDEANVYKGPDVQSQFSSRSYVMNMRPLAVFGLILVVLGVVALAIPSYTYFTTERVADAGFLIIDFSRPHTIIINPIVGVIALTVGILLVFAGLRKTST
jgi:hypothetical protein